MPSLATRLEPLGLSKHAELFAAHGIDLDVLPDLTDADLAELGLPLGERRRILKAAKGIAEATTPAPAAQRNAERRQLTVVFADLVDSTRLAASLDPEDMKEIIAAYQRAVAGAVARFGGYVAKPLGDGLLIYFGWPEAHEDDAERAVRAAIAALAAVSKIKTTAGAALATRAGIATGEVVVGDFVGDGIDEAGAVVGETPNLAARLQSVAEANDVVIADATMRLVRGQFACADLGERPVRGFATPVRIWRVEGERSTDSRFAAFHGGTKLGAMIGRDYEAGFVVERWRQSCEGEGQVVLISGEAGIGKSRLVAEIVQRLAVDSARRILYQASPLHMNTALYPVARQIEARAGIASSDDAEARSRKLAAALPNGSARDQLALRYLADLMSVTIAGSGPPAGSSDEQREAALGLLIDICVDAAKSAPLLVLVEDAHWLDATTLEYLDRLIARLEKRQAMVVVTYRPEFKPPWDRRVNTGVLSLGRLGRRYARAMIDTLTSDRAGMTAELVEEIVAKSDGIPLFVEELTGSALDATRSDSAETIQIPSTLKDSLSARLDRLGSAKEVAQVAAAIGREFAASTVAAVLGRREDTLGEELDRLMAIEILFQPSQQDDRFVFKHALVQEAAYESMLKSRRREVHAAIAQALERQRPELADSEPEVLANHLAKAGNAARAAECWRKAANLALRNSAYREAIGAFRNGLPLMADTEHKARADIHRAIASAYFASGDQVKVREHLDLAMADAEAAGDQVMVAEIAVQQGHDLVQYGDGLAAAIRYCERALDIATRLDDEALAYGARFSIGQAQWISGNFAEGVRVLLQNLPENMKTPDLVVRDFATTGSVMLDSLSILGSCLAYRGEFERGFGYLARAERLMTARAFDFAVVQYHLNRAHLQRGDAAIALPLIERAVRHTIDFGLRFTLPWHRGLLGYCHALLGNMEVAVRELRLAITESAALGLPHVQVYAQGFLSETLLGVDRAEALVLAEAALEMTRAGEYRGQEAELLRLTAAATASIDAVRAVALATEGLALARTLGMRPEEGHALRNLGDIKARAGEHAAPCYAAAREIYDELGMPYWLARTP